jgi:hypothetical protein
MRWHVEIVTPTGKPITEKTVEAADAVAAFDKVRATVGRSGVLWWSRYEPTPSRRSGHGEATRNQFVEQEGRVRGAARDGRRRRHWVSVGRSRWFVL